jgi:hypothetical protein
MKDPAAQCIWHHRSRIFSIIHERASRSQCVSRRVCPSSAIAGIRLFTSSAATNGIHPWLARYVQRGSAEMLSTPGYPEGHPQVNMSYARQRTQYQNVLARIGCKMILRPDIANGVPWLARRLNRGEVTGYRVGRTWRMTHGDVEDLIERHRNRAYPEPTSLPAANAGAMTA